MILRIAPIPAFLLLAACSGGAEEADEPTVAPEAGEVMPEPAAPAGEVTEPEAGAETATPNEAVAEPDTPVASTATTPAQEPAAPAATPAVAAATAPAAFSQCKACHSVEPGKAGIGPSLAGVFGAGSAHMAGFDYSPAMKGAGLVWNEETLDAFLANPTGVVPGTKMPLGLKDDAKRKAVIDYLKTL